MILGVLLPYGVREPGAPFFTPLQEWIFPFCYYIHDFGQWLGPGIIIPVFNPTYSLPLVLLGLGLLWFVLGLSTSALLHALYLGQIQQRPVILLLLIALASQLIITYFVFSYVFDYTLDFAIPLPFHTLLVLTLAAFVPERNVRS
jgi:hypothetical protein